MAALFRLAKTVQKQTENCPDKAKKMQLKLNKMEAPFKQVITHPQYVLEMMGRLFHEII